MSEPVTTESPMYNEADMAVVTLLGARWLEWQKEFPLTVGESFMRVMSIAKAVDTHVMGVNDLVLARSMAVEKLNELLASNPSATTVELYREAQVKVKGIEKADPDSEAYFSRTVRLLVDEFPIWMENGGLGGFLGTLGELHKVYAQAYDGAQDDRSVPRSSIEFVAAFEMRAQFGLADMELEALRLAMQEE